MTSINSTQLLIRPIFTSDMPVTLTKSCASDSDIVHAARVSTLGEDSLIDDKTITENTGLIKYLMKNRHGSPFEHATMTFFVSAPIFVFREFMRHRIASYNEESARYKVLEPKFYVTNSDRPLVQIGKTGAYEFIPGTDEQYHITSSLLKKSYTDSYLNYVHLLDTGIAREVARSVLPVAIFSSMYVTMNARGLMNFLSLRVKSENSTYPSYPQYEIEQVARQMENIWSDLMPITQGLFNELGRVCP